MSETDTIKVNVALHVHTLFSACAETRLEQIGDYCRRKGVDVICVTDHNTITGALALKAVVDDLRVVIGEEILTSEGEIIGLFLKDEIEPGLDPLETAERIKGQGGLVYIPHPFDPLKINRIKKYALMRILDLVDMVEVFNAKVVFPFFYHSAAKFAKIHGKVGVAGSDAHYLQAIDACLNEIEDFSTPAQFLENMKNARLIIGRSGPLRAWWVGIKNVLAGEGHVVKRYGRKR